MTMDATRLGNSIVDGMKTVSTFSSTQEAASRANMIKLAQAVIDEIEDYYAGSGGTPSDDNPEPLGTADPGISSLYSRGDHVHPMPDAADVGADPAGTAASAVSAHLGAAPHVALSSTTPAALGSAAVGVGTTSARADHVHAMPSAGDVGADPAGTASSAVSTHLGAAPHVALSSATPQPLGSASAGSGTASSKDDHVHAMPSATDVGAQPSDALLTSIAALSMVADRYLYGTGADAVALGTITSFARSILDDADAAAVQATLSLVPGTNVQGYDADLAALAANSSNGLWARIGAGTGAARTLTGPAAGISVSNGDGVGGNPTLALANDLSALEGLGSTGIAVRSAPDTWVQRSIAGTAPVTVTNGDGVSGNPTVAVSAASTSASGVVEIATQNEYADGKVLQTSDWRARYSQNRRMYGARVMSLTTTPARDGVLSGSDFAGTQAWAQGTTQGVGPYFDMVLTTASSRGWGSGTTLRFASLLSRCRFRQLVAWTSQSTTRTGAGFGPTITAISDVATATAVGVRFVNDGGTLKGAAANGTSAEQTAAFAALTDGTFYWLEYDCDGTTANFYVYDVAGTLVEGPKTLNTYVPGSSSTNCAFGMYSRAYSGTPSHYDGGSFTAWGT